MARSQGADVPKVTTTTRPPTRFPDADLLRRASCPQCTGDEAVSYRNRDGHVYCRCLTCAYRFVV